MNDVRKRVAVIFGGQSTEHDVSKISAAMVLSNLPDDKYDVLPVYITKDGRWLLYENAVENPLNTPWERFGTPVVLSPDATHKGLLRLVGDKARKVGVDAVFPMIHGKTGEDGAIAGLCELAGIPYVGCGVFASAVCFDKHYAKIIAASIGLRQAKSVTLLSADITKDPEGAAKSARSEIKGTAFVKPSASGSSVGVSKVKSLKDMTDALVLAAGHGKRVIAEKAVTGREIECAVLGGEDAIASGVGEILPGAEFYDYNAKYNSASSETIVSPDIPEAAAEEIRRQSVAMFKAVGGRGMARIDFFLEGKGARSRVIFNEINTIPGFTSISMYSMLWAERGIGCAELLDRLVMSAFER
jgi:D-alanine-D-alanine ligase